MRFGECDVTSSAGVMQAFANARPDVIVHMATALPTDKPDRATQVRNDAVRRDGTHNLVETALRLNAYYVHLSSHFVAAPQGDRPITEETPNERTPMMISAIDAETTVRKGFNRGMRGCILQICTVYCADSPQTQAIVNGVKQGLPVLMGGGANYWSFIHPNDVATAIGKVLDKQPSAETYLIGDNEPMRMLDCLQYMAYELHAQPPKSVAPFLAKLVVGGDTVNLLTESRRVSNAKARRQLGWEPRYPTFRQGFAAEFLHR
jgi:nucleoside-diphosphate-sugar epimerase